METFDLIYMVTTMVYGRECQLYKQCMAETNASHFQI